MFCNGRCASRTVEIKIQNKNEIREVLKMKRNPFTPLGEDDLTGSERIGGGNDPVRKEDAEKHDSPKAGREGQAGEQRRGSSKNSPGRS
jgi:hypothetical protein